MLISKQIILKISFRGSNVSPNKKFVGELTNIILT